MGNIEYQGSERTRPTIEEALAVVADYIHKRGLVGEVTIVGQINPSRAYRLEWATSIGAVERYPYSTRITLEYTTNR